MKQILIIATALVCVNATAQLSNNVPASGQVSIGTGTPTAGKQLTVNGQAQFLNSLEINETLTVSGGTFLHSHVKMCGISEYAGDNSHLKIIVTDSTGNITTLTKSDVVTALMEAPPAELDYCGGADSLSPHWFNGTNKVFLPCPNTQVAIGRSNPRFKLDVVGTVYAKTFLAGSTTANAVALINSFAENHSQKLLQLGKKIGATEELRFVVNNDGSIEITNVGSEPAITVNNNGGGHAFVVKDDVGEKIVQLENSGLLRSRKIRVDLGTWADYVFKPGYHLMTLKETEQFINKNGHLPNIPTETEIQKNGLDLGEMQQLQMQKIEELTLHLIEMNKTIENLQTSVTDLQKENAALKKQRN